MTEASGKVLLLFAALMVTAIVYWPGLAGGFVFDDFPNIVRNPDLHIYIFDFAALRDAAFSAPPQAPQRPLAFLTFAINWLTTGADPWAMKATNLAIHLINGLLLYAMLGQLLRASAVARGAGHDGRERRIALAVSACWLLLPINLTAVLYVVQRMESLCQTFVLAGLWLYFRGRGAMIAASGATRRRAGLAGCITGMVLGTGLGVLVKESAVLLPLYAFLAEISLLHFRGARGTDRRLWPVFLICLFVPAIVGAAWLLPKVLDPSAWAYRDFSLSQRLLTESRVLVDYLRWTLLPNPHALGLSHDDIAVSQSLFAPVDTLVETCGLAGLALVAVFARRSIPLFTLGIFWFLAAHLLTATVVPLELAFEHRNYFASIGALLAVFALLERFAGSARAPIATVVLTLTFCIAFAIVTRLRAQQWADPVGLSVAEARDHPRSVRANYQAAQTFVILSAYRPSAALDAATAYAERAATLPGNSILPEQALIIIANRAHGADAESAWRSLIAKLDKGSPSSDNIEALLALNECFISELCTHGRDALLQAYATAMRHAPVRGALLSAYMAFMHDVMHEDHAAREGN